MAGGSVSPSWGGDPLHLAGAWRATWAPDPARGTRGVGDAEQRALYWMPPPGLSAAAGTGTELQLPGSPPSAQPRGSAGTDRLARSWEL